MGVATLQGFAEIEALIEVDHQVHVIADALADGGDSGEIVASTLAAEPQLDEVQVRARNVHSKLSMPEVPTLFVEFHGSPASVAEQSEHFGQIAHECGGGPFEWAMESAADTS
jgi:hypothetical protein